MNKEKGVIITRLNNLKCLSNFSSVEKKLENISIVFLQLV